MLRLRPGQWVSRLALPRPIWLQHTPVSPILLQDSPHRRLSSYLGSLRWNLDDSLIGNGHGTRRFTLSPNALFLGDSFTGNRAHFVAQEGLPSLTALENPPRLHCTVESDVTFREISQMSPISCKSLNGKTWVVKKGKSSEFNLQNDEHVKSS